MCASNIKCIQLKSYTSKGHTGCKFGAYGIHLACQMHVCVTINAAHVCIVGRKRNLKGHGNQPYLVIACDTSRLLINLIMSDMM